MKINFMYVVIVIIFLGVVFIGYLSYSTLFLKSCKGEKCDDNVLSENISEGSGSEDVIWLFAEPAKVQFEGGDFSYFKILPEKNGSSFSPPVRFTTDLVKPDGSRQVQEILLENKLMGCPPCDPILGDETVFECGCAYYPYFESQEIRFDYLFDQAGVYILKGKSEDGKVRLRDFSFEIVSVRINELFIQSATKYNNLSFKRKVPWTGNYDLFQAVYFSDEFRVDIPDAKQEIIVYIGITQSEDAAKNKFDASYGLIERGMRNTELGQPITALLESNHFFVAWYSEEKTISIEGFQFFGDDDKNFVREYLEKYPSSLV